MPTAISTPLPLSQRRLKVALGALPPARLRRILATREARELLTPREAYRLLIVAQKAEAELRRTAPSPAWIDAADEHGAGFPVPGMISSRVTGRWTPPQCVELEDQLDGMSDLEAAKHSWPSSCSAHAIQQIQIRGGQEVGRWRRSAG